MRLGSFTLVLHSHIPYVRKAGRWPHGEETLHEAMAGSYVPLLNALYDLKEEGVEPRVTVDVTPILLEQLADEDICNNFELYLEERLALAEVEIAEHDKRIEPHLSYLARWYRDNYAHILTSFRERYARDLPAALRRLGNEGNLDILTGAASHAFLPLFDRDSTIYGQLKTGIESTRAHLEKAPRGAWLPECGYRPAYMLEGRYKPGIEEFLGDLNLSYFIADTHAITGVRTANPVGTKSSAAFVLPLVRKAVVRADDRPEARTRTTFQPYFVQATNVAVLGRDERTSAQVWSANLGYPGDFVYREFHRRDSNSGLQYWRITAANTELGQKEYYDPYPAFEKTNLHAAHFVDLVTQLIRARYFQTKTTGIVVAAYDTELFGHWWFEGIAWLKQALRLFARSEDVELITARDYLERHPPTQTVSLSESSWGNGGDHSTWLNADTEWLWHLAHAAERSMEATITACPDAQGEILGVLSQAARELLLLQSSDWPFLISTGQAKEYATGRFHQHLARFNRLTAMARQGTLGDVDRRFLENVMDLDNPFPAIDYRVFAARD